MGHAAIPGHIELLSVRRNARVSARRLKARSPSAPLKDTAREYFAALVSAAPCRSVRSCRLAPAWYRQLECPADLPLHRDTGDTIRMEPGDERRTDSEWSRRLFWPR